MTTPGGFLVQEQEIELSIGDSLQVGQQIITIVDIEGDVVSLRIEHQSDVQQVSDGGFGEIDKILRR